MKLATLDDIVRLKVDHSRGCLVNVATDAKVTLRPFRIVYARYARRNFLQANSGRWEVTCGSADGESGFPVTDSKPTVCMSATFCMSCKPVLIVGLQTVEGSLAVIETSASVARAFSDALSALRAEPVPIFQDGFVLKVALTEKSASLAYAQVALRAISLEEADQDACMEARERLRPVVDRIADRSVPTPKGASRPSLSGAALKM